MKLCYRELVLFYLKIELTEEEESQIRDTLVEEYKANNLAFERATFTDFVSKSKISRIVEH
jgi:hypothetical protein